MDIDGDLSRGLGPGECGELAGQSAAMDPAESVIDLQYGMNLGVSPQQPSQPCPCAPVTVTLYLLHYNKQHEAHPTLGPTTTPRSSRSGSQGPSTSEASRSRTRSQHLGLCR